MNDIPEAYDKSNYLEWHNKFLENGRDLQTSVDAMRESLRVGLRDQVEQLGQLLLFIKGRTEPECRLTTGGLVLASFEININDFTSDEARGINERLLKSTDSIIEKIWRKNRAAAKPYVTSENISEHISDLVRTSVVCPTLFHAKEFAKRLKNWEAFTSENDDNRNRFPNIKNIRVDEEVKAASGYFAYHGLVDFDDDNKVEVQLYSSISQAWRSVSHRLYERSRITGTPYLTPGSSEARLISLGHLLHLAENELDRLMQEIQ